MRRKSRIGLVERKNMVGYLFILPFLIGLFAIFLPAIVKSIMYAFSVVDIQMGRVVLTAPTPTRWKNFSDALFVDTHFRVYMWEVIQGMIGDLITIIFFSFFIAIVLNQKFIGRGAARTIFFLPVLLATGIIAAADVTTSFTNGGIVGSTALSTAFNNGAMAKLLDLQQMLESVQISPTISKFIYTTLGNTYGIVNSSGVQILIFLSALQGISPSLFESAKVEGATKWEEFWKITFPMLTPMILVNVVYTIVDSFSNPKYQVLSYIQSTAFEQNNFGLSAAFSWLYFLVVLVIIGIIWGLIAKRIQYLD